MSSLQDHRFRIYLLVLSVVATGFIVLATSKYGAGVSSDAARNLSTANSLLAGKGFVDMIGQPFILWPPLYPMLLAALSWATKWSTFQAAWYLNLLLYPLNIWLSGWLLYLIFRDAPAYAAAGALIITLSRSMLRIHANVASEPLFETLILFFVLTAAEYLQSSATRSLWSMCILAGLAALQRYPGIVLVAVALAVIFYRDRQFAIRRATLPLLVSVLPISAWIGLHNLPVSGTLFGPRELGAMLPMQNIGLSLTKIMWWFVPRFGILDWLVLRPWISVGALLVLLAASSSKRERGTWLAAMAGDYVWPGVLFTAVYFLLLAFTVVTADHLDLTSDRYYVVLLPFVVAFILLTLRTFVVDRARAGTAHSRYVFVALFAIWMLYPIYGMQSYLRQALIQGEPTNYNIANSANFREMSVVRAAAPILATAPQALVYSNYVNIVWFIYGHPVAALPFEDASLSRDQRLAALRSNYPGWPPQPGYIIWFTPNQYHHIAAPDELQTLADMKLLYQDKTGQIYWVSSPAP